MVFDSDRPKYSVVPVNKYQRTIPVTDAAGNQCAIPIDIYSVLKAFDVRCPAIQHAIKKALMPGQRGAKSAKQDLTEAIDALRRAIELLPQE